MERQHSYKDKCYHLYMDEFLSSKELFALVEVMIGARAVSQEELLELTSKLKRVTTLQDEFSQKDLNFYEKSRSFLWCA